MLIRVFFGNSALSLERVRIVAVMLWMLVKEAC